MSLCGKLRGRYETVRPRKLLALPEGTCGVLVRLLFLCRIGRNVAEEVNIRDFALFVP